MRRILKLFLKQVIKMNTQETSQSAKTSKGDPKSPTKKIKQNSTLDSSDMEKRKIPKAPGEQIAVKIERVFRDRDLRMVSMIVQAIYDDKLSIYKRYRKEHDSKISELDKEKTKIQKRKKNRKERMKALKQNTKEKLLLLCKVIKATFKYYQQLYYESDHYRNLKLLQMAGRLPPDEPSKKTAIVAKKDDKNKQEKKKEDDKPNKKLQKSNSTFGISKKFKKDEGDGLPNPNMYAGKKFIDQLYKFLKSPFKDDIKFGVHYMMILTRDKLPEAEDAINKIFYDAMFNILINSKDETNKHRSFETISYIVDSDVQRHKLVNEGCFSQLFQKMMIVADSKDKEDQRILEKLSVLLTRISFHQDLYQLIINQKLLGFILKICDQKYSNTVRSNAVLAISLLTYNDKLFDEIIKWGVIDLIMDLCQDQNQDILVQQFSTLALVHFALNEKSLNMLIEKGVLDLFDTFGSNKSNTTNQIISTNISWIFVALCKSGITGNRMLVQGITRDMFLVSCNPDYQQIRHLVITGFGELGKFDFKLKSLSHMYDQDKQTIKEIAIVGMHEFFVEDAQRNIDILLNFSMSDNDKYQYTAFWALKDYILLSSDSLIPDISNIVQAFIVGCVSDDTKIQTECANALSFLVTHRLVYVNKVQDGMTEEEKANIIKDIQKEPVEYILDAIMHLSGNKQKSIGTTAFSILSSLSKYTSQCKSVMAQISRDIAIPENLTSKNHHEFILQRLMEQKEKLYQEKKDDSEQECFTGLYSLLRLSQEPSNQEIQDASDKYVEFIQRPYDPTDWKHLQNENYFLKVFKALKNSADPVILIKLLKVIKFYINLDQSNVQLKIINPDTILWMLGIIETQHQNNQKYLSCLCSSTLLSIVSRHEILFDYQEVAIIRKFNLALQNIDVFDNKNDEIPELEEPVKTLETMEEKASMISSQEQKPSISSQEDQISERAGESERHGEYMTDEKQKEVVDSILMSGKDSQKAVEENQDKAKLKQSLMLNLPENPSDLKVAVGLDAIADKESPSYIEKRKAQLNRRMSISMQNQMQSRLGSQNSNPESKLSDSKKILLMPKTKLQSKAESSANPTKRTPKPLMSRSSTKQFIIESQREGGSPIKIGSKPESRKSHIQSPSESEDTEEVEKVNMEDISPDNEELIDSHLRDSLIKAFMVIFTNEKSQHLLLNKDLIDIAFNCLEFCNECTLEAKRHVARLISIIFKFPQVQSRLMVTEVVNGIGQLLNLYKHKDIIRHTIKACTYISMNYEFIKNPSLSVDILKDMLKLLDIMPNRNDQFNIIMTIKNIIRGDKQNKRYFYDNRGVEKFSNIILTSSDMQLIEMSIQSLAELASYKKVMVQLIQRDEGILQQVFEKSISVSNDWMKSLVDQNQEAQKLQVQNLTGNTSHSLDSFNSKSNENFTPNTNERGGDPLKQESKFSYSIDDSQIEIPEFMKNDLDHLRAINNFKQNPLDLQKMTRSLKIRNSMYYMIARAIKFGFDAKELFEKSQFLDIILEDLSRVQSNTSIFPNLLLIIQNLKFEPAAVIQLIGEKISDIINIMYQIPTEFHFYKESLLKVVVDLISLEVRELSKNPELFQIIFSIPQDSRSNDKMIEVVMWLATSLCEQKMHNENFHLIVQQILENQILNVIYNSLAGKKERLILQALNLLTQLANEEVFRKAVYEQQGIISQLKTLNERVFKTYKVEIETALSQSLQKITTQQDRLHKITSLNQNLIDQALQKTFIMHKDQQDITFNHDTKSPNMNLHTIEEQLSRTQHDLPTQSSRLRLDEPTLIENSREDDIERIRDENKMVEKLIETIANITNERGIHMELIQNGVVRMIRKYVQLFLERTSFEDEEVEMQGLPIAALNLAQAIARMVMNICLNSPDVQLLAVQEDIVPIILSCYRLQDYQIKVCLATSMASLICSEDYEVRRICTNQNMLQKMLEELNQSQYHKVKRIMMNSLTELSQVDQQMFEFNDKVQARNQNRDEEMHIQ